MAAEPTTQPAAASGTVSLGDLTVNRMGFGAMRLTGSGVWGDPPDREGAKAVLRRAVELGVTLIDTAASYGPEVNEELVAETLHPYPDGLVVATKGGLTRPGPGRWQQDGRPETLRESLEGSLRRLRLERIDLYQLHSVDPQVPLEESVGALAELQRQGKIRPGRGSHSYLGSRSRWGHSPRRPVGWRRSRGATAGRPLRSRSPGCCGGPR